MDLMLAFAQYVQANGLKTVGDDYAVRVIYPTLNRNHPVSVTVEHKSDYKRQGFRL